MRGDARGSPPSSGCIRPIGKTSRAPPPGTSMPPAPGRTSARLSS